MNEKSHPEDIAGGQAIIEGVMMRHGNKIAAAVRKPDREIAIREQYYVPLTKRYKFLGLPFIRGSVTLLEMMVIGMKCLMYSAELALTENDVKPKNWEMTISVVIGLGTAILFFVVVPAYCFSVLKGFIVKHNSLEHSGGFYPSGDISVFPGHHPPDGRHEAGIHVSWSGA